MRRRHTNHSLFVDFHHCSAALRRDDHVFQNDRCVLGKWVAFKLTVGQEGSSLIKINGGSDLRAVVFAANGEYLVSGGAGGVRVWRAEDGKQLATMVTRDVQCLAVSKDGRWIAAGTIWGNVFVWDARTHEKVFSHRQDSQCKDINEVDFSPDSTRLVAASDKGTASIWDISTRKRVQKLRHGDWVTAAKYSPQGDRIATATPDSIRVWDSNNGSLLVNIPVSTWENTGILWFNNHLFVISDSKIKQFEASTGSTVSEWPVPNSNSDSCIALPKHGGFIAYSAKNTVTFWDVSTHAQLGLIQHPQMIRSNVLSPDDRFLAIVEPGGTITINTLAHTVSVLTHSIMVHMDHFLGPTVFPTCITRYHAKNIDIDVSNSIFSLETRSWRVVTTRVLYYSSSVHEPKCDPTQVERSHKSQW